MLSAPSAIYSSLPVAGAAWPDPLRPQPAWRSTHPYQLPALPGPTHCGRSLPGALLIPISCRRCLARPTAAAACLALNSTSRRRYLARPTVAAACLDLYSPALPGPTRCGRGLPALHLYICISTSHRRCLDGPAHCGRRLSAPAPRSFSQEPTPPPPPRSADQHRTRSDASSALLFRYVSTRHLND